MLRPVPLRRALVALAATAAVGLGVTPLPAYAGAADGGPGDGTSSGPGTELQAPTLQRQTTRTGSQRAARKLAQKAKARADSATPLTVTIDRLTPSVIPARGRIRVSGMVTNTSDETWSNVNTYAFVSDDPLTTTTQLEEAAQTDPGVDVGRRVGTDSERYRDTIASLAPGQSTTYSFSVPRGLLDASEPGVYWFGVHALGESSEGRDDVADGKARTFLPLVPQASTGSLPTSVVIPLRHQLVYADDGSVDDLAGWVRTLSSGGRLRSLVDLGASSGDAPVTWVVDPGLVDAVRRIAAGNPPRSLAANLAPSEADQGDQGDQGDATAAPSASDAPTEVPSAAPSQDGTSPLDLDDLDPVVQAAAEAAQSWLDRLTASMGPDDQVLNLPYGDLDVAGAAVHDPTLLQRAVTRAGTTLPGYDGTTSPVFSSPSGFMSKAGLDAAAPGTTLVMSDAELPRDGEDGAELSAGHPAAITTDGRQVVVASRGAAEGGPGPDDRMGVTAMRQRLLAEAAVRFLDPESSGSSGSSGSSDSGDAPTPLTVVVPHDWNPVDSGSYFSGLELPWLDLTTLNGVSNRATPVAVDADRLRYPDWQRETELDQDSFDAADSLMRSGIALQNLLTLNNIVSGTVTDQALGTASYSARTRPQANRDSADRSREWIAAQMQKVSISTPPAVTLSSSSGRFSATVTNGLDQPVTVALDAQTDDRLTIDGPGRVEVQPGRSTSVLLTARTDENGLHDVRLGLTDKRGTPLGVTTALSIRSAQVSNVIWLFLGLGAALLFGAIGLRLFRRIRNARRTPPAGEADQPGDEPREGQPEDKQTAGAGSR